MTITLIQDLRSSLSSGIVLGRIKIYQGKKSANDQIYRLLTLIIINSFLFV